MVKQQDPSTSLFEQQPSEIAGDAATNTNYNRTPGSRGLYVYKDVNGNYLDDTIRDRSNPTRSRFERPLDTIRSFERAANQDPAYKVPPADHVDQMDNSLGIQQRRSPHHSGPFDPSLASRNYYQGRQGQAPVDSLAYSNQQTLEATPQFAINDSLRQHVPLQNTASSGMAGQTYGNEQAGTYPAALPQMDPRSLSPRDRMRPIQLGSSDDGSNASNDVPTPKRASLGSRMKKRLSLGK